MTPSYLTPLANHLWQSTLFAAVAGLLTVTLRKHGAHTRYGLWLAASTKFLVPFAALVQAGNHLGWSPLAPAGAQAGYSLVMGLMATPFVPSVNFAAPAAAPAANPWLAILVSVWGCGVLVVAFNWWHRWERLRAAKRTARLLPENGTAMRVMLSASLLEPGVFGIWRPVLLLPEGILARLTAAELEAILEHEHCHVRRRDNLAAGLHMLVEAMFWFHPLVWWLEKQMVKERERACDEEVLRRGRDPEVYAEGILKVCRFYVESPLVCAAGVTGADLKRRIEKIMMRQVAAKLDLGRKLLLAAGGVAAVALPIVVGMMDAPLRAQSQPQAKLAFEVASIRENKADDPRGRQFQFLPGGKLVIRDFSLRSIIRVAYGLPLFVQPERLTGGPDWVQKINYDIDATAPNGSIEEGASQKVREEKLRLMLQTLLTERFKMMVRSEMKELPVYVVLVAKDGPKLTKAAVEERDCAAKPTSPSDRDACHIIQGGQGQGIHGQALSVSELVSAVAGFADRPVLDKTGLQGLYNIQTDGWVPMLPRPPRPPGQDPTAEDLAFADPARPTLFEIFDRLGLKLDPTKAPLEVYTIESAEKPTEN